MDVLSATLAWIHIFTLPEANLLVRGSASSGIASPLDIGGWLGVRELGHVLLLVLVLRHLLSFVFGDIVVDKISIVVQHVKNNTSEVCTTERTSNKWDRIFVSPLRVHVIAVNLQCELLPDNFCTGNGWVRNSSRYLSEDLRDCKERDRHGKGTLDKHFSRFFLHMFANRGWCEH